MRLRKNIRAPTRYEDTISQPASSVNTPVNISTRKGPPATTPAFEIPFTPYDPTLTQRKPAAFPSRDLTVNRGLFENGPEARQLQESLLLQSAERSLRKKSHLPSNFNSQQLRLLLFRTHSLRAILATSLHRSDCTIKLPRRRPAAIRTVRRRQPPPDPLVANNIPYFADVKSHEPLLEEVWDVFNCKSPSFLNQAVDAPPHGILNLIRDRRKGPNYIRKLPVLDLPLRGVLLMSPLGDSEGEPVAEHSEAERRDPLPDEPVRFPETNSHEITDRREDDDIDFPVNRQNGPFYDIEFVDKDFLQECMDRDNKKSEQHILISGRALQRFDDLVAQLAIDIYCQIYFEAKSFRNNATRICQVFLDLTVESDEHMHWVIAKRLLDKIIEFNTFLVPNLDLDRDVRPNASPKVSSFTCPKDRRYLRLKDVDWDYVSSTDLEVARAFLRQQNLPQSLLRDWIDEPGISPLREFRNSRSRSLTAQRSRILRSAAPTPSEHRGSRKGPQPDSGSEYQDEGEDPELNSTSAATSCPPTPTPLPRRPSEASPSHQQQRHGQQQAQRQKKTTTHHPQLGGQQNSAQNSTGQPSIRRQPHAPPRPSFARPGSNIAQAPVKTGTGPRASRKEDKAANARASAGPMSESSEVSRPTSRSGTTAGAQTRTRTSGGAAGSGRAPSGIGRDAGPAMGGSARAGGEMNASRRASEGDWRGQLVEAAGEGEGGRGSDGSGTAAQERGSVEGRAVVQAKRTRGRPRRSE
ncbi:MAG: hypothetical protein Q9165_003360 [Trypethelium subeluteriae]